MSHARPLLCFFLMFLGVAGEASGQPFAWFPSGNQLTLMNTATGEIVLSASAPADIRVGEGDYDAVSGHYLAITNIGTFRVRLSPPGLEPGVLPYTGSRLALSADGLFVAACSGSFSETQVGVCQVFRRSDAALLATYAAVVRLRMTPDGALLVVMRESTSSSRFVLRRYLLANLGVPVFTADLGTVQPREMHVGSTRAVISIYNASSGPAAPRTRLRSFEVTTGTERGELSANLQPFDVGFGLVGTRLYVWDVVASGEAYVTRYNAETLSAELQSRVRGTPIAAFKESSDGRSVFALQNYIGRSFGSSLLTFDATTLTQRYSRTLPSYTETFTLTPDPVCTFDINPLPDAIVQAPARGGVVEFRVTTEPRCGVWTAEVRPVLGLDAAILGPAMRIGSSTVQIAVPPRRLPPFYVLSALLTIAGVQFRIDQQSEADPPIAPVDARVRIEGAVPTLEWSVDEGPVVTSFLVQAGAVGGLLQYGASHAASARSWSPGALPPGNYFVQLRAVNDIGSSPLIGPLQFTIAASQPPTPAANLRVDARGSYVRLGWDVSPTLPSATHFVIEAAASGATRAVVGRTTDLRPTLTLTHVPAGTWDFAVRAVNDAGQSAASNTVTTTTSACSAPPTPPDAFNAIVTNNVVTLSWAVPALGADTFVVEAGSSSGAADLARISLPASITRLDQVAPVGTYALRVRAANACGLSTPSVEKIVRVQ